MLCIYVGISNMCVNNTYFWAYRRYQQGLLECCLEPQEIGTSVSSPESGQLNHLVCSPLLLVGTYTFIDILMLVRDVLGCVQHASWVAVTKLELSYHSGVMII